MKCFIPSAENFEALIRARDYLIQVRDEIWESIDNGDHLIIYDYRDLNTAIEKLDQILKNFYEISEVLERA